MCSVLVAERDKYFADVGHCVSQLCVFPSLGGNSETTKKHIEKSSKDNVYFNLSPPESDRLRLVLYVCLSTFLDSRYMMLASLDARRRTTVRALLGRARCNTFRAESQLHLQKPIHTLHARVLAITWQSCGNRVAIRWQSGCFFGNRHFGSVWA